MEPNGKCRRYTEAATIGSLEEKHFKGKHEAYINYANRTLAVLIQYLYDDHETISPVEIEESDQKTKKNGFS